VRIICNAQVNMREQEGSMPVKGGTYAGREGPLTEYGRWPAGVYLLEIRNIVGSYTQVGLHLPIRG